MTNAEAIEILKLRRGCAEYVDCMYVDSEDIDAIDMAISALEKQDGKKPKLHPKPLKNEVFWWNCPHCGAHNHTNTMHNFCHHCGGRIDWSDENGAD